MSLANRFIHLFNDLLSRWISVIRTLASYLRPEDDWVEYVRRIILTSADPVFRPFGRPLIIEKTTRDKFWTANVGSDSVEEILMRRYQRNLTSTRKYRRREGGQDWANGSFVYDPDDTDWQHHVYIFDNGNGTTDLYGHKETSAEKDPYGHVTDPQNHGDPDKIATSLLQRANVRDVSDGLVKTLHVKTRIYNA